MPRLLNLIRIMLVALAVTVPTRTWAQPIVVGCDAHLEPFEFKGADGKYTGFDIDLWEAIAADLKLDYTLKPMPFEKLLPALEKGEIQVALAAITITAEREKVLDFSYPYFDSGLGLLIRDDREGIHDIGDLTDKIIATKEGTTSARFAREILQKEIKLFPDIAQAYQAVATGAADAAIFDAPALLYHIKTSGQDHLKSVGRRYQQQTYGIALTQGSPLREPINISLLKLIEIGRYDTISRKWFGNVD